MGRLYQLAGDAALAKFGANANTFEPCLLIFEIADMHSADNLVINFCYKQIAAGGNDPVIPGVR